MNKVDINNLSQEELFSLEKSIQNEADAIVKRLKLIEILNKYGTTKFVGAKLLNVMTNKDIDIHCYVDNLTIETWLNFSGDLLKSKNVRRADLINYYDFDRLNNYLENDKGFGYFISLNGLHLEGLPFSTQWNTEISLVPSNAKDLSIDIASKMTDDKRAIILRIKLFIQEISKKMKQRGVGKLSSTFVYTAVLEHNIQSIEEFIDYIKQGGDLNESAKKVFLELSN